MQARYDRLVELTASGQPCSVRHVYYLAVSDGLVDKHRPGYMKVQRALVKLRREGRIPYSWITDNSRSAFRVDTWGGVDGFLADVAGLYRRQLWSQSPWRVEVWCESDSIAGTVVGVARRWRVPVFPTRGHSSETFAYNAVQEWAATPHRQPVVLYIGDHDPHGLEIEESLADKLVRFADREIRFVRLAVTWPQVQELGLTGTTPKKNYGYGLAVEAEALPPDMLRAAVDDAIGSYIDRDQLATIERVEAEERELLYELAGGAS